MSKRIASLYWIAAGWVLTSAAVGAKIEIVPVRSTSLHEITGNTIVISPGGQRIFFEVLISGWGPAKLKLYQVSFDRELLDAGSARPGLAMVDCAIGVSCTDILGPESVCVGLCDGGERARLTCLEATDCSAGTCEGRCEPLFVDSSRADFIFAGETTIHASALNDGFVAFGAVPLSGNGKDDPGMPRYAGTLVLDVPSGWSGTQQVGFSPALDDTFAYPDPQLKPFPLELTPARIVTRCATNADCDDRNPCTAELCDEASESCVQQLLFEPDFQCCDRTTGTIEDKVDDGNECTIEGCDGQTGAFVRTHVPVRTPCGDGSISECDSPDECDGQGACDSNFARLGALCGSAADPGCGEHDRCDGLGSCTRSFALPGTACGSATQTTCNGRDTCNIFGECSNNFEPLGTPCGPPSTSICRRTPTCDGNGACTGHFAPALTPCGPPGSSTICGGDFCDGNGNCVLQFAPAGNRCRGANFDFCDLPDECDGAGNCVNLTRPLGSLCGSTVQTTCNGRDTCDAFGECRSNFAPLGTTCGSLSNTECNRPDACDGAGLCLSNFVPSGAPCGSTANTECNRRDTCNGSGQCLHNYVVAGTPCGSQSASACDAADSCDGEGHCASNHRPEGTPCGDPTETLCDYPDGCDSAGHCVPNLARNGKSCEDGLFCNGVETCLSGACQAGPPPCEALECREETNSCSFSDPGFAVFPPNGSTLWRNKRNEIRFYEVSIALPEDPPQPGEILIQEMLPAGLYGDDLSANFSFTFKTPGLFANRELVIREEVPTFARHKWYAVRSISGWPQGHPFLYEFLVQIGDADGNRVVVIADLVRVNAYVPQLKVTSATIRLDITGDGKVGAVDLVAVNKWIPSFPAPRPSGH